MATAAAAVETSSGTAPVAVPVKRAAGGARKRRHSDQRWEVTEADLNMYGLIVGRPPSEAEKVAALTGIPNEATALNAAGAGRGGREMSRLPDGRPWSPAVMFAYLRNVYYFSTNLSGPQVTAWVRQLSGEARRKLQETQARLNAARSK